MPDINNSQKVDAILWDFDGTLADSAAKNIAITRQILATVAPGLAGDNLPHWLRTTSAYHQAIHGAENWRDLYRDYFGMNAEDIQAAGPLWQTCQDQDDTEVQLFDGILDTISQLENIPLGISSANSSQNIRQVLHGHGIVSAFRSIIGYEGFPPEAQKPSAEPGLKCLYEVLSDRHGKTIIYVGDHIADVIFARNIAARIDPSNTVISVIVTYSGAQPEVWREQPDAVITHPAQLLSLLRNP